MTSLTKTKAIKEEEEEKKETTIEFFTGKLN